MNILLLGAPGSGKGTQAHYLTKKYKLPHISTGDILRDALNKGTDTGLKAKSFMDKGELVPDAVILKIVEERIVMEDCKKGFILDGFPRTIPQAEGLDKFLLDAGMELNSVIALIVSEPSLMERITGRRVCKNCEASFHIHFHPPKKEGICDHCGGELIIRKDDTQEVAQNRFRVYKEQTEPLISYFRREGIFHEIDGEKSIRDIHAHISKILER